MVKIAAIFLQQGSGQENSNITAADSGRGEGYLSLLRCYIHEYDNYFQTSSLKQSQISCGDSVGRGKVCINGLGHMTKMAVTPVYGKNGRHARIW